MKLIQVVQASTRDDNLLDPFITNYHSIGVAEVYDFDVSDHCMVLAKIPVKNTKPKYRRCLHETIQTLN